METTLSPLNQFSKFRCTLEGCSHAYLGDHYTFTGYELIEVINAVRRNERENAFGIMASRINSTDFFHWLNGRKEMVARKRTDDVLTLKHFSDCRWEQTSPDECEYRANFNYCPHPEHACTCARSFGDSVNNG